MPWQWRLLPRRQPPMLLQWCMGGGMIPGDIRSRVVPQLSGAPTGLRGKEKMLVACDEACRMAVEIMRQHLKD